ncbi:MAG: hypothetical protein O3C69_04005 [Chloroflexi bacterium]|nr:hypothetical protein [Chloroflexota bacterium]
MQTELKALTERITRKVCDVSAYVTSEEIDRQQYLEEKVGARWDAINRKWYALGETD